MNRRASQILIASLTGFSLVLAQPMTPAIVNARGTLPAPVFVSPGQVVTIVIQGLGSGITRLVRAPAGSDLPGTLEGIWATYSQIGDIPFAPKPVPILEVHPVYTDPGPSGSRLQGTKLLAVTLQIPLEARTMLPTPQGFPVNLVVGEGDPATRLASNIQVWPFTDQVHILTSCEPIGAPEATWIASGLPCSSLAAHADGSLVSQTSPAKPGEALAAYALGLGQTNPPLVSGKIVTAPAAAQTTYLLDFNYRPNALATKPRPNSPKPLYAGATPGYVGLYQINFVVPPVPAGTPPCDDTFVPAGSNIVYSNLTVSVGGALSFDAVRICVEVPASQP